MRGLNLYHKPISFNSHTYDMHPRFLVQKHLHTQT